MNSTIGESLVTLEKVTTKLQVQGGCANVRQRYSALEDLEQAVDLPISLYDPTFDGVNGVRRLDKYGGDSTRELFHE